MRGMEERKHLEPKFSNDYDKLVKFMKKTEIRWVAKTTVQNPNNEFFTETDREF